MLKHLIVIAMAMVLTTAMSYADQSKGKLILPVDKTDPTNGRQMYSSYCAPCHGIDGRGHGTVAHALKTQPTDLTMLAKANQGRFPDAHVISILRFGSATHGTPEMPAWGPILGKINHVNSLDKELRMCNLSRYLEDIQVK